MKFKANLITYECKPPYSNKCFYNALTRDTPLDWLRMSRKQFPDNNIVLIYSREEWVTQEQFNEINKELL